MELGGKDLSKSEKRKKSPKKPRNKEGHGTNLKQRNGADGFKLNYPVEGMFKSDDPAFYGMYRDSDLAQMTQPEALPSLKQNSQMQIDSQEIDTRNLET